MTQRRHRVSPPVSDAQLARIRRLVATRDTTRCDFLLNSRRQDAIAGKLSMSAANALIEQLLFCPLKPEA